MSLLAMWSDAIKRNLWRIRHSLDGNDILTDRRIARRWSRRHKKPYKVETHYGRRYYIVQGYNPFRRFFMEDGE